MIKKILYLITIGLILTTPIQIQAIDVALTWTTDTYTPLDYQGKALPSRGSNIEVVAQLNFLGNDPKNLTFNWFLDDHIQRSSSGKNRQVFEFNIGQDINKKRIVRLEITNPDGSLLTSTSQLILKPVNPEIILTAKNYSPEPLIFSDNQNINFTALPYFFNVKNINELNFQWNFGGQKPDQIDIKNLNSLVLKINEITQTIIKEISVLVENINNKMQKARTTAEITIIPNR